MNRRTFGLIAAGAAAAAAIAKQSQPGEGWVLVADGNVNSHGRRYSDESLQTMADAAPGTSITTNPPEHSEEEGSPLGIVTAAKFSSGSVFVQVRWFGGKSHSGFIAPWGVGKLKDGKVECYKFEHMVLTDYSSFARATRI